MKISKRSFLKTCAAAFCLGSTGLEGIGDPAPAFAETPLTPAFAAADSAVPDFREAAHYIKLSDGKVHCQLCPCSPLTASCGILKEGQTCVCNVRVVKDGRLMVTNYGKVVALFKDPIEKNPLFHVKPSARSLALGTAGCNLDCKCCQNFQMSQKRPDEVKFIPLMPEKAVEKALEEKLDVMSFTYTEPVIFFEYMRDISILARKKGISTCMVSGGYIDEAPLKEACSFIDAFTISVKGFTEEYYREYCRGSLEIVKTAIRTIKSAGAWLELVVLVIPGLSDDPEAFKEFLASLKPDLGSSTPVHVSRFFPEYKLKNLPPTPVSTLENFHETASGLGFKYVYMDNVPGHKYSNTVCPGCKNTLILRIGLEVVKHNLVSSGKTGFGKCKFCGESIEGRFNG